MKDIKTRCSMLDDKRLAEMYEVVKSKWYDCNAEMAFERFGCRIPLTKPEDK